MAVDDIAGLRIAPTGTVRDTINLIDANRRQVALVMDDDDKLLGIVTDGDIRRGTLRAVSLDDPVTQIMNPTPRVASPSDSPQTIIGMLTRYEMHHMPVVDADGVVVGMLALDDLVRPRATSTPVVLMAGGRGTRLGALTNNTPKPMLEVDGMPLLEHILRNLRSQGFVRIYISVNYLAHVITDYFGDGAALGLQIEYVYEDHPLGTAGALASLAGRIDEPFVVMNSDLLTRVSLQDMLDFHRKQAASGTLGVREHLVDIPFGVVEVDGPLVMSMVEKPTHRSLVNTGIYVLDPFALTLLTPDEYADMPTLLGQVMEAGHSVAAFPIHESWLDVGRPEDLQRARGDARRWTAS